MRKLFLSLLASAWFSNACLANIVVDETDSTAIISASVFDASGNMVGMTSQDGSLPCLSPDAYPITVRNIGYEPLTIATPVDVAAMHAHVYELPDLILDGETSRDVLRLTCYIRGYGSLISAGDTVSQFTEYVCDYFIPRKKIKKYKGRTTPRVLAQQTYVRYANADGLDSIAKNTYNDDMSFLFLASLDSATIIEPDRLRGADKTIVADTINGKHGIQQIYRKTDNAFTIYRDGLAGKKGHRWSPWVLKLLGFTIDFTEMYLSKSYQPSTNGIHKPEDMTNATFAMHALGKGKFIKKIFEKKDPIDMNTLFEVYVTDREYLTLQDAQDMEENPPEIDRITAPESASPLDAVTLRLINRIEAISAVQAEE